MWVCMVTGEYLGGASRVKWGSGATTASGATALKRMIDRRGAARRTTRWGVARRTPFV